MRAFSRPEPGAGRPARLATAGISTLLVLAASWSSPGVVLGQAPPAGAAAGARTDVLRSAPFDRITLSDNTVLLVEPVSPRPLPHYDPVKEQKSKRPFRPPAEGNVGLPGQKSKVVMPAEEKEAEERANNVTIHLLQGEQRDFKVKRGHIKRIEYFEDMLLAEGDRLVLARNFARAFECYLRVRLRHPSWAGLDEHVNRLLFEEGSAALLDGDDGRGLRLLRELFGRKPSYPGLADKLAKAYGSRAVHAFELGMYARGRKVLHELEPLAPNHPIFQETRERFVAAARKRVADAAGRNGAARLDALTEALQIWPELEGAGALYAEAFAALPTLDVAVIDIPRPIGPWIHTPADERVSRLVYLPVLAADDDEATQGERPNQLAARLESLDLGRRLMLKLRPGLPWSDGSRPVSAIDVARAFTDRTEEASPQYNARWADLLDRVETIDEHQLEVRLRRALLRPASWLLAPVGPAHGGWDGRVATTDKGRLLVGDGPYRFASAAADRLELRAAEESSGASATKGRPRRLREVRFSSPQAAVGALVRGEVSLLEHVPPDQVATLSRTPEIKVGRLSRPAVHVIALDGRNPLLRNRTLRRALSYAIDRRTLLEESLLKRAPDPANTVADGPFVKGDYANAAGIAPLAYDPLLARMLVAAAKKEVESRAIKLTLEYPAIAEARAIVPRLVEAFRLAGVEVAASERNESDLEAELRAGRKFDLAYRVVRYKESVLDAGGLICPGYDAPAAADTLASVASPRILQLLLALERAPEWPSAKGIATQIDRECRDELPILPLWQLEERYAWRTRLKGPGETSEHLYQGIDTWEIEPWYAKDSW
jgi:peptide/nickel transport system substrate-binding protein